MSAGSPLLELRDVTAAWDGRPVVRSVDLELHDGEIVALLGPNGSGKSTLLRAIAGFEPLRSGRVALRGADLAPVPPHRRSIGLLFQEPTLFPHRTVLENIAYAPQLARRPEREVRDEVAELAGLLDLGNLLERAPHQLSGGERQRVALARSLAARPAVLLLDEPFASVDPELRGALHAQFHRALRERATAAIHVTHDREEGLFLGDRVALLFGGELAAVGRPSEVFARPRDARVARFLGYNVLRRDGGSVAVLPEEIRLDASPGDGDGHRIVASGTVGRAYRAILDGPDGERVEVRSAEPLPGSGKYRLSWGRSVPLAP